MFGSRGHVGDILEATYDDYDDDDEDDEPCFCECEDESNVGCCIAFFAVTIAFLLFVIIITMAAQPLGAPPSKWGDGRTKVKPLADRASQQCDPTLGCPLSPECLNVAYRCRSAEGAKSNRFDYDCYFKRKQQRQMNIGRLRAIMASRLNVVITVRKRTKKVEEFVAAVRDSLTDDMVTRGEATLRMVVVVEDPAAMWNRGLLRNAAIALEHKKSKQRTHWLFLDTDVPLGVAFDSCWNLPDGAIRHLYGRLGTGRHKEADDLLDGAWCTAGKNLLAMDGFSNSFWGGGMGEDRDTIQRASACGITVLRDIGFEERLSKSCQWLLSGLGEEGKPQRSVGDDDGDPYTIEENSIRKYWLPNGEAWCPRACYQARNIPRGEPCRRWLSKFRYCGQSEEHKKNGWDCNGCHEKWSHQISEDKLWRKLMKSSPNRVPIQYECPRGRIKSPDGLDKAAYQVIDRVQGEDSTMYYTIKVIQTIEQADAFQRMLLGVLTGQLRTLEEKARYEYNQRTVLFPFLRDKVRLFIEANPKPDL